MNYTYELVAINSNKIRIMIYRSVGDEEELKDFLPVGGDPAEVHRQYRSDEAYAETDLDFIRRSKFRAEELVQERIRTDEMQALIDSELQSG